MNGELEKKFNKNRITYITYIHTYETKYIIQNINILSITMCLKVFISKYIYIYLYIKLLNFKPQGLKLLIFINQMAYVVV